mmetsp:Transcript_16213/g.44844  ORF Transcript_16213/g.44844 Transcript_16213/m.44844 type:complete len:291 (+) Transcript_16213:882-1754(+)
MPMRLLRQREQKCCCKCRAGCSCDVEWSQGACNCIGRCLVLPQGVVHVRPPTATRLAKLRPPGRPCALRATARGVKLRQPRAPEVHVFGLSAFERCDPQERRYLTQPTSCFGRGLLRRSSRRRGQGRRRGVQRLVGRLEHRLRSAGSNGEALGRSRLSIGLLLGIGSILEHQRLHLVHPLPAATLHRGRAAAVEPAHVLVRRFLLRRTQRHRPAPLPLQHLAGRIHRKHADGGFFENRRHRGLHQVLSRRRTHNNSCFWRVRKVRPRFRAGRVIERHPLLLEARWNRGPS